MSNSLSRFVALLAVLGFAGPAHAAQYRFTRLVDHVDDDFSPRTPHLRLDQRGRRRRVQGHPVGAGREQLVGRDRPREPVGGDHHHRRGPGRERSSSSSAISSRSTTRARPRSAAFLTNDDVAILRASGTSTTTIASTAGEFSSFGFDTSLNNAGEVAFTGQLDAGDQGLFSGAGGPVVTHYTSAAPVLVDGETTDLGGGNFGRPSINNTGGEIAFWDRVEAPAPGEGIFAGRSGVFRTLGPTDRFYNGAGDRGDANNNDLGVGAFEVSFLDDDGESVTAIATSDDGALSIVADTLHGYGGFGFYAPAINNHGQVVFRGFLPDFATDGVFTGPRPRKDAIITSRDRLDGARIMSSSFSVCSEALNDSGRSSSSWTSRTRRSPKASGPRSTWRRRRGRPRRDRGVISTSAAEALRLRARGAGPRVRHHPVAARPPWPRRAPGRRRAPAGPPTRRCSPRVATPMLAVTRSSTAVPVGAHDPEDVLLHRLAQALGQRQRLARPWSRAGSGTARRRRSGWPCRWPAARP